jgi:hypothetical protein
METCRYLASHIDVAGTSRFSFLFFGLSIVYLASCGEMPHRFTSGSTSGSTSPTTTTRAPAPPEGPGLAAGPLGSMTRGTTPSLPDPDLHRPPPRRLLDIDWTKVSLANEPEATALWRRIAPTGGDWDDKLGEIPASLTRPLAIAVLRGGNFTCAKPPAGACAKPIYDVDPPADTAGFDDPCLRRLLALWAMAQLEDDDLPAVMDALLGIAAIPPPESQLVASAIRSVPEAAQDARLAILATAWRAGQHDLVDAAVGTLDETHLIAAATQHHITGAFDVLPAEGHRAVYIAAITNEALATRARTAAIVDLVALAPTGEGRRPAGKAVGVPTPRDRASPIDDKLQPDLTAALVSAVKSRDCAVAAAAARALDQHGDHRFVPRRPHATSTGPLMRAICVLASYEALQRSDETSLLPTYLPARGLERVTVTYDALSDLDDDGDGDPHTTHTLELVARGDAVLPELEDLARAMRHCTGTICVSDDREFRFVWKPSGGELRLSRIEIADRPPCVAVKP